MSENMEATAAAGGANTEDPTKTTVQNDVGLLSHIISEIIYSPINLILVAIISILIYKIIRNRFDTPYNQKQNDEPKLPKLRRDFTVEELKKYDGKQPDGRILVAVNGNVYDVTKGRRFYGPEGPYAAFGGRDASRGLATFSVSASDSNDYDDLSDLSTVEMDSVREWEMQFKERYEFVGKLLKPGELPSNYSDEEDEGEKTNENATSENDLRKRNVASDGGEDK